MQEFDLVVIGAGPQGLAAAAHLSALDYLGDVPWNEDDAAKAWYVRIKSRPSFRPLLNEWMAGVPASAHYIDLDF